MASNPTASAQSAGLGALDRFERLVNNGQFADVAFRVGESGELMYGHKAVLAEASEMFRAQFAGAFRESRENVREQAIPIVDIEPAVFKELLRYMYSDRVNVTVENVLDLMYGSNKYLLMKLKKYCEVFLMAHLSEGNALRLFDRNRRYELEEVNGACLAIICDNPIKVFSDEGFLALARKSVELIASQELMNCQTTQLLTAIEKWIRVNEGESKEGVKIVSLIREQKNRDFKCQKMHNFSAGHYLNIVSTSTVNVVQSPSGLQRLVVQRNPTLRPRHPLPLSIYGFGICIKSQRVLQPVTLDIAVVLTKNDAGQIGLPFVTKRTVTPSAKFCVEEILFEKLTIGKESTCTIKVHVDHGKEPLFCFKNFEPERLFLGMRFFSSYVLRNAQNELTSTNSILSYVLYDSIFYK
ncbi:hypothetical protein quinque_008371 [Culex quinquefasciatus]